MRKSKLCLLYLSFDLFMLLILLLWIYMYNRPPKSPNSSSNKMLMPRYVSVSLVVSQLWVLRREWLLNKIVRSER